ncbi:7alpha-cephem-methoxylase p8 chain related protein [Colletotrichum plurivorum]|uniref:7alpha-cephem-methoxylase p8 chain related protein n=1 Tax=Colletotrichum plurivorum TaxID=2175906 RepID=A0A8H6K2C1_9PEZI|nr:7alpha-cephem-methoxylase p8 chain related protein [Colletotrichum plurivorum]
MTAVLEQNTLIGRGNERPEEEEEDIRDVITSFSYLDTLIPGYNDPITFPKDPKDRENLLDIPGNRKTLVVQPATVTDVTRDMRAYTLDTHGFQFVKHTTQCQKNVFLNEDDIRAQYYPEVEQLLNHVTRATFVHFFDYAARGPVGGNPEDPTMNGPVKSVHCDQSYDGAGKVVMSRIEDKAFAEEIVANRRFQIINASRPCAMIKSTLSIPTAHRSQVWRPLEPVFKDPFAVTDARSVPESDLVGLPVLAGDYMDESWAARPNHAHRWYYKFAQQPDEVLIFKCFDSVDDGKTARRVLHSAFTDPAQEHMAPRESFEVRAIVVY